MQAALGHASVTTTEQAYARPRYSEAAPLTAERLPGEVWPDLIARAGALGILRGREVLKAAPQDTPAPRRA